MFDDSEFIDEEDDSEGLNKRLIVDYNKKLGTGSTCEVYHAKFKILNKDVCVKIIDLDNEALEIESFHNEVEIMSMLKHPNIPKVICSSSVKNQLWIVLPHYKYSSCLKLIKKFHPSGFKDEIFVCTILKMVLQAIIYLHKNNIIHRDIKADNIFINEDGNILLGDYGVSCLLLDGCDKIKKTDFIGSPCWMAPEILGNWEVVGDGYDEKIDIWSFGITAMELSYGRTPYSCCSPVRIFMDILSKDAPTCDCFHDYTFKFSDSFQSMINKCLKKKPKDRPSARELLNHRFFKQAKDAKYILAYIKKNV